MKSFASTAGFAGVLALKAAVAHAQDSAKTDPKHFDVVLENEQAYSNCAGDVN